MGRNDILPLVSIIVPVYNVEKYISRCIESLISQTYKNIEIILVDDGTQDKSGEICEKYAKKDKRIVVYHKENGGLSDARNYGIEKSNGEYLSFVDSDDYVDFDYIEFLYNLIKKGYKLSLCSLCIVYTSNNRICKKGNGKEIIVSGKNCIKMMCYHDEIDTSAYAKLYHKSLFENVKYPKGKLFEDIGTSYLLFDQCEKIICSFVPKYYYVIRDNSIVTSKFSEKKLDFIEMTDQMADYVQNKYPDLSKATLRRRGYARFSTLNQMFDIQGNRFIEIRKEIIQYLKKIALPVLRDRYTPNRDKIAYVCLLMGFPIYKFIWKIYFKCQRG
ncbi:MAG: glycosyltransferase family 2 protein [Firmicutes bacterium]|nr:glycosyltransferase family 2 protein [Bacillota bacterium]